MFNLNRKDFPNALGRAIAYVSVYYIHLKIHRNTVTDAKLVQTKFKLNDKKFCSFYSLFDDRVFGQSIIYLPLYKISFNLSNVQ